MKSPIDRDKKDYRVILTDDHPIVREGMKKIINKSSGLKVVAEASSGQALLEIIEGIDCDIVALDISMPGLDGIEVLSQLKAKHPNVKVLMVTMHKEKEYFRMALSKGADGYVLKDDGIEKIITAIHDLKEGKRFFSSEIIPYFVDEHAVLQDKVDLLERLTKREIEILKLVVSGYTSKAIAEELEISKRTADNHRFHIMEKLGVENLAELIRVAFLKGLV